MSLPGGSSHYPGVVFELRAKLLEAVGPGTARAVTRRIRKLSTKLPDEQWLELVEAVKSIVDLATSLSRPEVDAQLRELLQQHGSDEDG